MIQLYRNRNISMFKKKTEVSKPQRHETCNKKWLIQPQVVSAGEILFNFNSIRANYSEIQKFMNGFLVLLGNHPIIAMNIKQNWFFLSHTIHSMKMLKVLLKQQDSKRTEGNSHSTSMWIG